ncbi:DUF3343 domain-containing protein [Aceticella autotrophica]|uniref:DUF3343 domain-containing protein n=1 Tax=Aceticella autotrophica TaxID=2755338 RepID=A0A975GB46_9THEO|nr:DUF3343 domain-containing protein [Aceticella autotrophica]QSZ27821.1 DUF3343 domain-containing protein [Aceticella autotrophica]
MKGHFIAFKSTNYALMADTILKNKKIKFKTVPTPRVIDLSCGIAIMYEKEDEEKIKKILREYKIEIKGFYKIE